MIFDDYQSFLKQINKNGRLLGLDLGTKNIGISISDTNLTISSPFKAIKSKKFTKDAEEIHNIITENTVEGLVIGLPINMDGSEGPKCQSTRQFARNFLKLYKMPIILWDERLSTEAVTDILIEADVSRKKRKVVVDKMAASYILQSFLDSIKKAG